MSMKYREVEFKYNAENITLPDFTKFCQEREPKKFIIASGYDYFYAHTKDDSFCRYRVGPDCNQLTFKRKTVEGNNFVRTEHNLDLIHCSKAQVEALCAEFGYSYNCTLFKTCFIYKYSDHIIVYYIVYDEKMTEKGRFVEIEMAEDYDWGNEQAAWDALTAMERICKPLGVSAQSRVKKSLFEQFRKDHK